MTVWIFPIKPLFAAQIYSGLKKYELRRRVRVSRGDLVVLYETAPVKALTGEFVAGEVVLKPAEVVRRDVIAGLLRGCDERDLPYVGLKGVVAVIEVRAPRVYPEPITLDELRKLPVKLRLHGPFKADPYPELMGLIKSRRGAGTTLRA